LLTINYLLIVFLSCNGLPVKKSYKLPPQQQELEMVQCNLNLQLSNMVDSWIGAVHNAK
jgi:hypothetical protein